MSNELVKVSAASVPVTGEVVVVFNDFWID